VTISIRELGLADEAMVGELLDAIRPGWADALAPGASGPRAFVTDARSLAIGGYVDNEPAGLIWGVHVRRPSGALMTYLHELDVVEAYRRRGLATMLIEAAIGAARRTGSTRLWLITEVDNEPAGALYRATGAEVLNDGHQRVHRWELS